MKRKQAIDKIEQLIVILKAMQPEYIKEEDIEALYFAEKQLKNIDTLKGMLIFDKNQCTISGWKDRVKAIEIAETLFDKYLED